MDTRHSRRRFLASLLWALLLALRPGFAWAVLSERRGDNSLDSRLGTLLRHEESARLIGREYLRIAPHEANVQILSDLIELGHGDDPKCTSDADAESLRERLWSRTRQDFEEGHIVRIHGWILSLTETRLCALAALAGDVARHPSAGTRPARHTV